MKTYYVHKIKSTFFEDGDSQMHQDFTFHDQVKFEGTTGEFKEWVIEKSRLTLPNEYDVCLTVFYFEEEYGLENYKEELLYELLGDQEESFLEEPSEKSWLIKV